MKRGVDLKTVKEYLGHADIHTTMRYAHFAPKFAAQQIIEAQREEALSLAQLTMGFDLLQESSRRQEVGALERIYAPTSPTD